MLASQPLIENNSISFQALMAAVSLMNEQGYNRFFHEAVLRNLAYWQAWLDETHGTDLKALDNKRACIVRAILFSFDLEGVAWPRTRHLITTFSPYMERRGFWE